MIILIACMSRNGIIGKNKTMPWHNQEELNYFKATTMGHHVLMGSVTYLNLPKALEGRTVHVLTSKQVLSKTEPIVLWHDVDQVIKRFQTSEEVLFVCGGASVYQQCLPYADKLYLSVLPEEYDGDCYFPNWRTQDFECVKQLHFETFEVYQYERK